jgi:hypothetical protein
VKLSGATHESNVTEADVALQDALMLIDSWIKRGELQGNGCDEMARNGGLIIAYNLVYALRHGQDVESGPHRDEHSPEPISAVSETAPKWIPVSECLPEGDGAVLGYGKDYTGEWIDTFGRSYVRQRSGLITHWMPLPAAPVDANRQGKAE